MNGSGDMELFQNMLRDREAKRKELRAQLEELEHEIQAIRYTQRLYMKEQGIPELPQAPLLDQGLSLTKRRERALVEWAERNSGLLVPKEAKKALIAAGLIQPGKGAGWIVYGTLANMDCWDKIRPGRYRLIQSDGATPNS
jgi:hypothetical protein